MSQTSNDHRNLLQCRPLTQNPQSRSQTPPQSGFLEPSFTALFTPVSCISSVWSTTVERIQTELANVQTLCSRLRSAESLAKDRIHIDCVRLTAERDSARKRGRGLTEINRALVDENAWYQIQLRDALSDKKRLTRECKRLRKENARLENECSRLIAESTYSTSILFADENGPLHSRRPRLTFPESHIRSTGARNDGTRDLPRLSPLPQLSYLPSPPVSALTPQRPHGSPQPSSPPLARKRNREPDAREIDTEPPPAKRRQPTILISPNYSTPSVCSWSPESLYSDSELETSSDTSREQCTRSSRTLRGARSYVTIQGEETTTDSLSDADDES